MTEIYAQQREIQEQVMASEALRLKCELINSTLQIALNLHIQQMNGLMLATMFNPNFCKPKDNQ